LWEHWGNRVAAIQQILNLYIFKMDTLKTMLVARVADALEHCTPNGHSDYPPFTQRKGLIDLLR